MYLKSEIINSRICLRKFWSHVNSFMPERIKSESPKILSVNNCKISHSTEIAKHFNKYFCNIGKALVDKVDSVNSYDYRSYLPNLISSFMFICPASDSQKSTSLINLIRTKVVDRTEEVLNLLFEFMPEKLQAGLNKGYNLCLQLIKL